MMMMTLMMMMMTLMMMMPMVMVVMMMMINDDHVHDDAAHDDHDGAGSSFHCHITMKPMVDPVFTADGHSCVARDGWGRGAML